MELKNYDPNITWSKQKVRVTLMQWDYSVVLETEVGGNCKGFDIFESSVEGICEKLPSRKYDGEEYCYLVMTKDGGDTLECEDEDQQYEDWLRPMVVAIEIIEQEPE